MKPAPTESLKTIVKFGSIIIDTLKRILKLASELWLVFIIGLASALALVIFNETLFVIFIFENSMMACLIMIAMKAAQINPDHKDRIWVAIGSLILFVSVSINILLAPYGITNVTSSPISSERIAHTFAQVFSLVWAPIGASIIAGSIVSIMNPRHVDNNNTIATAGDDKPNTI